jgi:non-ribosomal peptide synthetase component F
MALEGLVGFFVNTLVLRIDFSDDPSFRDLLQQVRHVCLDAYAYQDLPFEKLVEAIQPERGPNRQVLFQIWFQIDDAPLAAMELPGLVVSPWAADMVPAEFDLWFRLSERMDGLQAVMLYSTELFNADTIMRMLEHFQTLLGDIVAHPDKNISAFSLVVDDESEQLISSFNATIDTY